MEWQPIETAPKDGTAVLCFWTRSVYVDGRAYAIAQCHSGTWVSVDDDEVEYWEPTHWMPLPPPPTV